MHDNFFLNWMLSPFIILAIVLWCWHEDAWQRKLDNALANCLVPMTDGSCASWDLAAIRRGY